jgi:outer membrane scaffolding protein for murein synthesis (MipA/OmpV family)
MNPCSLIKMTLAVLFAVACGGARAQAFDAVRLYGTPSGAGEGSVGLAVIETYEYMGSDERRTMVFPGLGYQWTNGWFAGTSNGVGYLFSSAPDVQYGVRVTADFGRKESRSAALTGMGNIDARPEIGVFFNYFPTREFFLTSSLRYGAGNDRDGLQVDLGAGYGVQFAPQWRAAAGVAATWVNGASMQENFGVTSAQALSSGYAAYSAGAGLRDVRANLSLNWFITKEWTLTGAASVSSLQGDAPDSPIVRQRTSTSGVLALGYQF